MERCQFCGNLLPIGGMSGYNAMHYHAKYCSPACKQAAYRRRKDATTGTRQRRKEGAHKAWITKQRTSKPLICEHCGSKIMVGLLQTNRTYCSNACKQAAYRKRKSSQSG